MEIAYGGAIRLQDYARAQALDGRARRFERWTLALVAILLLVQLLPLLQAPWSLAWVLPAIPLLVFVASLRFIVRWQIRRAWQNNRAVFDAIEGRITDDQVTYNTAKSESAGRWDMFQASRIAPDMILLYQTPQAFNMFPRHFFGTDAEWTAFTQLVEAKLPVRR